MHIDLQLFLCRGYYRQVIKIIIYIFILYEVDILIYLYVSFALQITLL